MPFCGGGEDNAVICGGHLVALWKYNPDVKKQQHLDCRQRKKDPKLLLFLEAKHQCDVSF